MYIVHFFKAFFAKLILFVLSQPIARFLFFLIQPSVYLVSYYMVDDFLVLLNHIPFVYY